MAGRGSRPLGVSWYAVLAVSLLMLTVYGSIIPLRYQPMPYEEAIARYHAATQYDPTLLFARGDWVVNGLQYALLSYCVAAALSVDLRLILRLAAVVVVIPLGFLLASWLEFLQVFFPPRTVSINDLIVERTGVVAGALSWLAVGQPLTNWLRRFWEMRGLAGLARQALPMYLGLLGVVSLIPFDLVLDAEELAVKYRQGRIELAPFAHLASGGAKAWVSLLVNAATFAPLGVLAAWIARPSAARWPWSLSLGLASTSVIEGLQLFIFTRYCDVTDIVTGTAAVMLGWWAAASIRDRQTALQLGGLGVFESWEAIHRVLLQGNRMAWGAAGLGLIWVGCLVAISWYPFTFSTDPAMFQRSSAALSDEDTAIFGVRRMNWAPFVDYYWNSRYGALDQFLNRSLSFAPIGLVMALIFGRRERLGAVATVVLALFVALVIEMGQYFIPERHPGTTDLMIQVFSAWFAFALARHVAHAVGPDRDARGAFRYRVPTVFPRSVSAAPPRRRFIPHSLPGAGIVATLAHQFTSRTTAVLRGPSSSLERWFDPLPYAAKVAFISGGAAVLTVAMVLVMNLLGML